MDDPLAVFYYIGTYCDTTLGRLLMRKALCSGFSVHLIADESWKTAASNFRDKDMDCKAHGLDLFTYINIGQIPLDLSDPDKHNLLDPDKGFLQATEQTFHAPQLLSSFGKAREAFGNILKESEGRKIVFVSHYGLEPSGVPRAAGRAGVPSFIACYAPCRPSRNYPYPFSSLYFKGYPKTFYPGKNQEKIAENIANWNTQQDRLQSSIKWVMRGSKCPQTGSGCYIPVAAKEHWKTPQTLSFFPQWLLPRTSGESKRLGFIVPPDLATISRRTDIFVTLGSFTTSVPLNFLKTLLECVIDNSTSQTIVWQASKGAGIETILKVAEAIYGKGITQAEPRSSKSGIDIIRANSKKGKSFQLNVVSYVDHAEQCKKSQVVIFTGTYCLQAICWATATPMIMVPVLTEQGFWASAYQRLTRVAPISIHSSEEEVRKMYSAALSAIPRAKRTLNSASKHMKRKSALDLFGIELKKAVADTRYIKYQRSPSIGGAVLPVAGLATALLVRNRI